MESRVIPWKFTRPICSLLVALHAVRMRWRHVQAAVANPRRWGRQSRRMTISPSKGSPEKTYQFGTGPEVRSEERRVGKECRSGWWRYHEKKKEMRRYRS